MGIDVFTENSSAYTVKQLLSMFVHCCKVYVFGVSSLYVFTMKMIDITQLHKYCIIKLIIIFLFICTLAGELKETNICRSESLERGRTSGPSSKLPLPLYLYPVNGCAPGQVVALDNGVKFNL